MKRMRGFTAFKSFCAGVERGRFPQLSDRDNLWRLLVTVPKRKALNQAQRSGVRSAAIGRQRNEADLAGSLGGGPAMRLEQLVGEEPTPEFAAVQVAEEYRNRLGAGRRDAPPGRELEAGGIHQ